MQKYYNKIAVKVAWRLKNRHRPNAIKYVKTYIYNRESIQHLKVVKKYILSIYKEK